MSLTRSPGGYRLGARWPTALGAICVCHLSVVGRFVLLGC